MSKKVHLIFSNFLKLEVINMKKHIVILGFIFFVLSLVSPGQVWRLNNIPGVDADFKINLQDAIDNISSGDTIYVEQSPFSYGNATITKKVILIGAGYWLIENDSTQANPNNSEVQKLIFNSGSEGSVVSGLFFYGYFGYNTAFTMVEVNADSLTFSRNFLSGYCFSWGSGEKIQFRINGNRKAIIIEQNWINNFNSEYGIKIDGVPENMIIRNNFIHSNEAVIHYAIQQTNGSNGLDIINNVIWGDIYTYDALHINNILLSGTFYNGAGGIVANNICNGTQYPTGNNNKQSIDMSTVFVDYDLYIDYGYFLVPGSAAIGAGFNGGDCGAFGYDYGGNPYVLSGLSGIPAIFYINFNRTVFPSDTTSLKIHLKAKSHN